MRKLLALLFFLCLNPVLAQQPPFRTVQSSQDPTGPLGLLTNLSGGQEIDLINAPTTASTSFNLYQTVTNGVRQLLFSIGTTGATFNVPFTQLSITNNPYTPPVAFPGPQAFGVQIPSTGTCTTTNNNCYYNFINIPSDNVVVGSGTSGTWVSGIGLFMPWHYGGAAMTGQRIGLSVNTNLDTTTGNTAGGVSYGAASLIANANANDNGTDTTLANSRGQIEAVNIIARLNNSATNYRALQGGEVDVQAATGSSVYEKVGWQIVQLSTDAVQGSTYDTAIGIANQGGAVGWKNGILFGGLQGAWPFVSTATAITCAGACGTLQSFIDMSNATISGSFLKSPGFAVGGTGTISSGAAGISSGQVALNGTTSGTASVTATSVGSMNLATTFGITVSGTAPTSCSSTGSGSGASCTFAGGSSDSNGAIVITAGTTPSSSGTFTVNFSGTLGGNQPACVYTYDDSGTAWSATALPPHNTAASTTLVTASWNNNGTALTASSTYRIMYHCFGK